MVNSSLVKRRLNTISIFNPFDGEPTYDKICNAHAQSLNLHFTWIIVVKTPALDVVLGQLCISEELHGFRNKVHIVPVKLLQLKVNHTNLNLEDGKLMAYASQLHMACKTVVRQLSQKKNEAVT